MMSAWPSRQSGVAEPVNPATGEIAGEAVEIPADAPTATAVRQVVVAPGDEAAWAGLARGDRGTPPEAAVRADLRQRFLSAVAACGRDTDKVEAALLKKYGRPFPALTVAEQEHACEVLEAEAEHIHGGDEADA